jgi:adenine-specific DNA-methyltransferase
MTHRRQKLELTWIGKESRPRLEPRILLEDPARSYHAPHRISENDIFDNRLIFGDNLLALKALEQEFTGKIQCIYIDPPFNTGQAFTHYDDGIEHSLWLSLMCDRLEILAKLLASTGSIWVHCDDVEQAYLKVMMDEILGRENFVTTFIWQKVDSPNDNKVPITPDHEFILCYAKSSANVRFKQKSDHSLLEAYGSRDENGRLFRDRLLKKNGKSSLREDRPSMFFAIKSPDGTDVYPVHDDGKEACWAYGKAGVENMVAEGTLIWKKRDNLWVPYTREYAPDNPTRPYPTIWTDVLTTRQAKAHQRDLLPDVIPFETPKTEQLLQRIVEISTFPGDLVLDSFAGSGTTGAVAHKMGRRWIMVELGGHCHTHIIPRLQKVIDGADQGGITASVGWQGGGGFRYFRLAPSLLEKDRWGNWVINKQYNAAMLAEAACKLEGFTYAPSETHYWQQGQASESDFLYVTTQTLTHEQLQALSEEVGPQRTLLVLCAAYRGFAGDPYPNLTLKKIPQAVLARCEYGRDDYSLQVENLPANRASNDNAASVEPVAGPGAEAATGQRPRLQMGGFGDEKA